MTIRIFVLDDHELVRTGLQTLLECEEDMEVVGQAATAQQGLEQISRPAARRGHSRRPAARRERHRGLPGDPVELSPDCLPDVDLVRRR